MSLPSIALFVNGANQMERISPKAVKGPMCLLWVFSFSKTMLYGIRSAFLYADDALS